MTLNWLLLVYFNWFPSWLLSQFVITYLIICLFIVYLLSSNPMPAGLCCCVLRPPHCYRTGVYNVLVQEREGTGLGGILHGSAHLLSLFLVFPNKGKGKGSSASSCHSTTLSRVHGSSLPQAFIQTALCASCPDLLGRES